MGLIKTLAKTYGNYFLTIQGVKVMKTTKKDDHAVVGLGETLYCRQVNGYGSVAHQARG